MIITRLRLFLVFFFTFFVLTGVCSEKNIIVNFRNEVVGASSKSFSSFVGTWYR